MADIIQLNQTEIKSQLGELVRQSVEDTLNALLDAEADQMRNVFCDVPRSRGKEIGAKLKAIFAQEDRTACLKKAEEVAQFLRENKMRTAANTLEKGILEALTYTNYPHEHWLKIRSNNGIERINREIRRRTNAVGCFPDGNSALMLVCARLRFVSASEWGVKTYLNMERLYELERERESEKAGVSA